MEMEIDMNTTNTMMTTATTTTHAFDVGAYNARLASLTPRDLCQHVRNLMETCGMYARWHDTSARAAECAEHLHLGVQEQVRRYGALPVQSFDIVHVETNFKHITLRNATWTPYTTGRFADGRNGVLVGVDQRTGKEERFDWAHLDKMHPLYPSNEPKFTLVYCG